MLAVSTLISSALQQALPIDIRRIQKTLSPLGELDRIVIDLTTTDGRVLPIFGSGCWALLAVSPSSFRKDVIPIRVDNGDEFLIYDETGESALLKSVEAVLRATLHCLGSVAPRLRLMNQLLTRRHFHLHQSTFGVLVQIGFQ